MLNKYIKEEHRRISIIGLAKNAGKTTVLNRLISESVKDQIPIGIASIGVDGEKKDAWLEFPKPPIHVYPGMLVVTGEWAMEESTAEIELLKEMKGTTNMGSLFLVRIKKQGDIKVGGTPTISGIIDAMDLMFRHGTKRCLIDGAYDRQTSANPMVTDGIIPVIGATVHEKIEKIMEEADLFYKKYTLPSADDDEFFSKISLPISKVQSENHQSIIESKIFMYRTKEDWIHLEGTLMTCLKQVGSFIGKGYTRVVISGSFTDRQAEYLLGLSKKVSMMLMDSTKCFLTMPVLKKWFYHGNRLLVYKQTPLLFAAVNPTTPWGIHYDPEMFIYQISRQMPGIPMVDVVKEKETIFEK
ncbi:hypothetical protein L1765_08970 [Microaerobacter geothermalis]|uniref:lysine 5,6-aminomutase reactivase subunit KamB n=1 Tax=Microaerobacter geothermalis TaxID=674972 RepID=UPI001F20BAE9|nr:hypothetical protein [Microaerobacter geothermalis]MCF6094092.1 hypothetical protein [Microaerobacter geothermalis]